MKIVEEFKSFAMKGNVVDMAIGVIIGGAFGKIVTSLINDIVMPFLGLIVGGVHFSQLKFILKSATETTAEVALTYGNFLQTTFDFIIIAAAIFSMIKFMNALKKKEEDKPQTSPPPSKQEVLLEEIRDLLKK